MRELGDLSSAPPETPESPELLDAAAERIRAVLDRPATAGGRVIVGIAGAPAAGKSTLAAGLAARFQSPPPRGLGPTGAVAVPMDGFHLSNMELARLGLAHVKGAPQTFDAAGFVHLVRRIRAGGELVYAPGFERAVNEAVTGMIPVFAEARLVVVEGNYLLLPQRPWSGLRELFDLTIFVHVPAARRVELLLRRQRASGSTEPAAYDWVHRNDEANARLVEESRHFADLVLSRSAERD